MSESVAWCVYTIPDRQARASDLALKARAALVIEHTPDPAKRILNELAAWKTSLKLGQDKPWAGVMQDDCILCSEFTFHANLRLKEAKRFGYAAVSFYTGRKEDKEAQAKGERWRKQPGARFLAPLALAMQRKVAERYVEFAEKWFDPEHPWIDTMNAEFFRATKIDPMICLPNLVDHDLTIPSSLGHTPANGGHPRSSRTFTFRAR